MKKKVALSALVLLVLPAVVFAITLELTHYFDSITENLASGISSLNLDFFWMAWPDEQPLLRSVGEVESRSYYISAIFGFYLSYLVPLPVCWLLLKCGNKSRERLELRKLFHMGLGGVVLLATTYLVQFGVDSSMAATRWKIFIEPSIIHGSFFSIIVEGFFFLSSSFFTLALLLIMSDVIFQMRLLIRSSPK